MTAAAYAFRDSELAAARLEVVAELFDPATRAFLEELGPTGVGLALDLGCGPGHTTRLIVETLAPRLTVGLDASPRFLALASASAPPATSFVEHDVTTTPFPAGPADLAFCRFLLSHVRDREAVLADWGAQLRPGGSLLVQEVERIETGDPTFLRYLATVRRLLAGRGHLLEVGPELAAARPHGLRVLTSRLVSVRPEPRKVAHAFLLNLRAWLDESEADPRLEAELAAGPAASISWRLRELVLERSA